MDTAINRLTGHNSQRLVWLLAFIGLVNGGLMLLNVSWSLTTMRSKRVAHDVSLARTSDRIQQIESWVTNAKTAASQRIAATGVPGAIPHPRIHEQLLMEMRGELKNSYSKELDDLSDQLYLFTEFLNQCEQFSAEYAASKATKLRKAKECRASLRSLAAGIESREGLELLKITSQIRSYRKLGEKGTKAGADEIINNWIGSLRDGAAEKELGDLALLCEILIAEDERDSLVDLKDNRFQPSLARLRRALSTYNQASSPLDSNLMTLLDDFEASTFGAEFERKPSIQILVPSQDGLYSACKGWLDLAQTQSELSYQWQTHSESLNRSLADLEKSVDQHTLALATEAEESIFSAWQSMAWVAGACSIVFLFLARRIANTVSQQVSALDEQSQVLEREIQERTQAEREKDRLNTELRDAARQAGMAEVATGVLHNVGNVLNSVNVSAGMIMKTTSARGIDTLEKITELLSDHSDNFAEFVAEDPKGQKLPSMLDQICASLKNNRDNQKKEVTSLVDNIEHIKSIVSMQQSFASQRGVTESVYPIDLVEDALKLNGSSARRHRIELVRSFDDEVSNIIVDRHRALQVLVNLVKNSQDSLKMTTDRQRKIKLTVADDGQFVLMSVSDNGVGISKAHLERIFQHGFTTKKTGHGFGLHTCAIVAQEAGGSLTAYSEGEGQGATFTLKLPKTSTSGICVNSNGTLATESANIASTASTPES